MSLSNVATYRAVWVAAYNHWSCFLNTAAVADTSFVLVVPRSGLGCWRGSELGLPVSSTIGVLLTAIIARSNALTAAKV